jgi:autotransporter translocation and assembly factor TamB
MGYKKAIALLIIVLLASGLVLFLRGPYVSNMLKRAILPELGAAIGREVVAQKIYFNLIPLFVEAKGVKAFDGAGERVFAAERIKGYISLSGIFRGEIGIRRIAVKAPAVWTDREQASEVLENIRRYQSREQEKGKKPIRVRVDAVQVKGGMLSFYDMKSGVAASLQGINGEAVLRAEPEISLSVRKFDLAMGDFKPVRGSLKGSALIGKDGVRFRKVQLRAAGAAIEGSGSYSRKGTGSARIRLSVPVESVKEMLGLEGPGSGEVNASGDVRVSEDLKDPYLDLQVKGDFHLETLMELLKAGADIKGPVGFDGEIKGKISEIAGRGSARLRDGSIYGIKVDDLRCGVSYSGGVMSFREGRGEFYGGKASAEASITLPRVESFNLDVGFSGIDSPPALELIGLGDIKIPYGKVDGELHSSGSRFSPRGWIAYRALKAYDDVLGRVREIKGNYQLQGDVITLTDASIDTGASRMLFNGNIDIKERRMALDSRLETTDLRDLTSPYFTRLTGSGQFGGSVSGKFDDPLIEGNLNISGSKLDDYLIGDMEGEVSYKKDLLTIKRLEAQGAETAHSAGGSIGFPGAQGIFDFREPVYDLTARLKGADLKTLLKVLALDVPFEGIIDSEVNIKGKGRSPVFTGSVQAADASAYGVRVSSSSLKFSYDTADFKVTDSVIRKGSSTLDLRGVLHKDGSFKFTASSSRLLIGDLVPESIPFNYTMSVEAEGEGTFEAPEIRLTASLRDGEFKGAAMGGGTLEAALRGRSLEMDAGVLDGKVALKGSVELSGEIPWSAEITLGGGRYDFLLRPFLKEVPEDMSFDVEGSVSLAGTRSTVQAYVALTTLHAMLYGQGFSNEEEIKASFEDGRLYFRSFMMRSGNTSLSVGGDMEINKSFNVTVQGKTSLLPFKGLSSSIRDLTGDADFVFGLQGPWARPVWNGGIDISNGSFAIKKFPKRLSSINGYIYVDEDRVVVQRLSAMYGGGDLEVTGVVKLDGFSMKQFYLDAILNDISVNPSEGFVANLGGNVLFRGSPEGGDITGELMINRARYRERLEWKSWLLRARPAVLPKAELDWADKIELNVKVYGANNITIDNNIARAPLKIDMVVRGTVGSPALLGRVESREGQVYFRNNEFRIIHATADFTDTQRTSPYIDIYSETTSKGYHIWLSLQGRADQFDLTLTSDPPLGEVEILSLLTVGEFGESLSGLEGGIGAAEATSFLTGKFQDVVEERLKSITGFSRFQIDPYVSKTTGTVAPRITVSKRLMSDRLFVTYSTAVGATEEQELKLEYLLSNHISLLGARDELGTLGGDVKFRFEFK